MDGMVDGPEEKFETKLRFDEQIMKGNHSFWDFFGCIFILCLVPRSSDSYSLRLYPAMPRGLQKCLKGWDMHAWSHITPA